jgi:hypothetical protein
MNVWKDTQKIRKGNYRATLGEQEGNCLLPVEFFVVGAREGTGVELLVLVGAAGDR